MKNRRTLAAACLIAILAIGAAFVWHAHPKPHEAGTTNTYADPATCLRCHADAAQGYARTGMAHAFYTATAENTLGNAAKQRQFYHSASDTYYELTQHDGQVFEHRWQKGPGGAPDNAEELSIDYVMGSGNHVRTFLHREQDGTLSELPMAWYAEDGGLFAMNPGYDNPKPMTRRPIAYECMFCHNGYPRIPDMTHRDAVVSPVYTSLPEGIDCQRCHGPGAAHVKAAQTSGVPVDKVRSLILNPATLPKDRQMEVCEQCHLETTSHLLPDRIRHYDQQPFGYDATKPLASFITYFQRDPAYGRTDNFEIVDAPYRLRQSKCYLATQGALTCETCHNPHDLHKGPESASYYANICLRCHSNELAKQVAARQHPASNDCVSCHMPKRRTEDVVHAVMTDHLIQKFAPPAKELLAPRQEIADVPGKTAYHGPVRRYMLDHEVPGPNDALYTATAQVIDGSNLEGGIPALQAEITSQKPSQPNFSLELGDALRHSGDLSGAITAYRDALRLDPDSSRAQRRLGVALGSAGQIGDALNVLNQAIEHDPQNPYFYYERAILELQTGDFPNAIAGFRKALELKPSFADAEDNLGAALAQTGDSTGAEAAFHTALQIDPYNSETHSNLALLYAGKSDWTQAAFHLQKAVTLDPSRASAHGDYAVILMQLHRTPEAETQARAAIAVDAKSARLHDILGQVLSGKHQTDAAAKEFQAALSLDPQFGPAELDLAEALLAEHRDHEAVEALMQATRNPSPAVAHQAGEILHAIGPR